MKEQFVYSHEIRYSMMVMNNLSDLEKDLGISFINKDYLQQALTHRSYLNENPNSRLGQNEPLDFRGDAVLELVVTEALYSQFPEKPEGELTISKPASPRNSR